MMPPVWFDCLRLALSAAFTYVLIRSLLEG